jgi:hypothetical protein
VGDVKESNPGLQNDYGKCEPVVPKSMVVMRGSKMLMIERYAMGRNNVINEETKCTFHFIHIYPYKF